MKIITLAQIKEVLPSLDLIPAIEAGFVAYSEGRATVPPVGEMILDKGEVHIKSGFIKGEDFYVIKIASGFYGNSRLGPCRPATAACFFSSRAPANPWPPCSTRAI